MTIPGKEKEIKRYRRASFWDYKRGASFFITIAIERSAGAANRSGAARPSSLAAQSEDGCAMPGFAAQSEDGCAVPRFAPKSEDGRAVLGQVVDGQMVLSPLGRVVAEAIDSITRLNPGVVVFGRAVMPDHVHFNVNLAPGLDEPLKTLGKAISRFKNFTIKQSKLLAERSSPIFAANGRGALSEDGCAVRSLRWQQGYHDRLCLSREFIDSTERYIAYNPLKWQLMYATPGALAVHEPLDSPRLDPTDYWKGVGNTALLSAHEKLISLRISRRLTPAQLDAAIARISRAVDQGFVILSGFVSPGEKRVRDMLCARKDARFIRILPSSIPNRRFKPESRYIDAFLENRYLEIARGNEEVEFSRAACLDYNAEIVEIANAVEGGFALYFKPEGLVRLGAAQPSPLPAAKPGAAQPSSRLKASTLFSPTTFNLRHLSEDGRAMPDR